MVGNDFYPAVFWFFLGVIIQGLRFSKSPKYFKVFLLALAIPIIGFLPFKKEVGYSLIGHLKVYLLILPLTFFVLFHWNILSKANELIIIFYNIILLYIVINHVTGNIYNPLFLILLIPSIFCILITIPNNKINNILQIILYIWYMILTLILIITQINTGELFIFLSDKIITYNPSILILNGMVYLDLTTRFIGLLFLIPIPGKHQSMKDRLAVLKEYLNLLSQKYISSQLNTRAILILIIFGIFLYINYQYKLIQDSIIINLSLILLPIIIDRNMLFLFVDESQHKNNRVSQLILEKNSIKIDSDGLGNYQSDF